MLEQISSTVLCKTNANEIRRSSFFVPANFRRKFVELSGYVSKHYKRKFDDPLRKFDDPLRKFDVAKIRSGEFSS